MRTRTKKKKLPTTAAGEMRARLRRVIDQAGGQAAFARLVWGDTEPYKGLVGRWYNGRTGISVGKAAHVAKKTGWRAAWILSGELPEREGMTRTTAALEADLAAMVERALTQALPPGDYEWRVSGSIALKAAVAAMRRAAERAVAATSDYKALKRAAAKLDSVLDDMSDGNAAYARLVGVRLFLSRQFPESAPEIGGDGVLLVPAEMLGK